MPRFGPLNAALGCLAVSLFAISIASANVAVSTGGTVALNGGTLDLASTDLTLDGAFALSGGSIVAARHISINIGGALDGGGGAIVLFGNWVNAGNFNAGSGSVDFVDGSAALSTLSGNATFDNVSFVSTTGKTYQVAAGSTQSVAGLLTILGNAAHGIQFTSSVPNQAANIDLLPGGAQNIAFVGVSDVHAPGQHLAANETNDGGSGNATGWFGLGGGANLAATPALSLWGVCSLLLLLPLIALRVRRTFPH